MISGRATLIIELDGPIFLHDFLEEKSPFPPLHQFPPPLALHRPHADGRRRRAAVRPRHRAGHRLAAGCPLGRPRLVIAYRHRPVAAALRCAPAPRPEDGRHFVRRRTFGPVLVAGHDAGGPDGRKQWAAVGAKSGARGGGRRRRELDARLWLEV